MHFVSFISQQFNTHWIVYIQLSQCMYSVHVHITSISILHSSIGFAARVVLDGPNPRQGHKTDNAHPPIHPTRYISTLSVS